MMKTFDMMMIMKGYARDLSRNSKDENTKYKVFVEKNRLSVKKTVKGKPGSVVARVSTKEVNNWEVSIGNKNGANIKLAAKLADKMADYAYTPLNKR